LRYSGGLPEKPVEPQPEPTPPKASLVVVSHQRAEALRRCLEAIERSDNRETFEVMVVDNGSTDASTALDSLFPNIRFMRLPRNFGLTKALNIGIRSSVADYLFLLHDDTEVAPDTVRVLAEALDACPDAGAVCPLLVNETGAPAPQVGGFPPNGTWEPVEADEEPVPANYARGAAIMFRSFFFKGMRQIDERYGQFGSDAELCFKIRAAGKKVLILPSTKALHHGRTESSPLRDADFAIGVSVFMGKRSGFLSGLAARLRAILAALGRFRFAQFSALISGQKIDGTQS
jgi:GT2 family glycosyltransferase